MTRSPPVSPPRTAALPGETGYAWLAHQLRAITTSHRGIAGHLAGRTITAPLDPLHNQATKVLAAAGFGDEVEASQPQIMRTLCQSLAQHDSLDDLDPEIIDALWQNDLDLLIEGLAGIRQCGEGRLR